MLASCPTCGAAMVPMIFSSFCPRDCDRKAAAGLPTEVSLRYPHVGAPPGWTRVAWVFLDSPGGASGTWNQRVALEQACWNTGRDPAKLSLGDMHYHHGADNGDWMNMLLGAPTPKYGLLYSVGAGHP